MISIETRRLELRKLHPLTISRGTQATSENLFVFASDGVQKGIGELSPATASEWTAQRGEKQLREFVDAAGLPADLTEAKIANIWQAMREFGVDPPAMAALDVALWDLLAKQRGTPLYKMFGLQKPTVPTSVTVGINPPNVVRERAAQFLGRTGAKCLKVKLGSPDGIEADRLNFQAASEAARLFHAKLRVDANGGWTVAQANEMIPWLAERRADYVEQPLPEGAEAELPMVFAGRALPIFVDESCRFSEDVAKLAGCVDGVSLKLMKCGGLTGALKIVAEARARRLKTMIGCMSESSIAIAAGASIGALFDHIDLDSHLNLNPDPADGAPMVDGVITPTDRPGHGGRLDA